MRFNVNFPQHALIACYQIWYIRYHSESTAQYKCRYDQIWWNRM